MNGRFWRGRSEKSRCSLVSWKSYKWGYLQEKKNSFKTFLTFHFWFFFSKFFMLLYDFTLYAQLFFVGQQRCSVWHLNIFAYYLFVSQYTELIMTVNCDYCQFTHFCSHSHRSDVTFSTLIATAAADQWKSWFTTIQTLF